MKLFRFACMLLVFAFTSNVLAQTVYTTKTGEKYHKSNCRYLKYSKKETTIKRARAMGYQACKVCKPRANAKTNDDLATYSQLILICNTYNDFKNTKKDIVTFAYKPNNQKSHHDNQRFKINRIQPFL